MRKITPVNPKFPHLLHGGDYNPDQWLHMPDILEQDLRLMKLAKCNAMTTAIFAWSALEPEEGVFTFRWLDKVMDDLEKNGVKCVLATPSGARPAWMSEKYPEVLRVDQNGIRNLHGTRHNHCFTSPVYREKVTIINEHLASRYKGHPALILWHLSNEYSGECRCELCCEAFRAWVRRKYNDDLDALNKAWWTAFWSHTYSRWSQIEPPSHRGENLVHGHNLDWKRFVAAGGTFVATYLSGIADENDLCFLGGWPGPLRAVLGVWAEEIDALSPDEYNTVTPKAGSGLNPKKKYRADTFCDLIHTETAKTLAVYGRDFYAGRPALTVNALGKGAAYYMAARCGSDFLGDFYGMLLKKLGVRPCLAARLPAGVTAQARTDGTNDFVFIMNFTAAAKRLDLSKDRGADVLTGKKVGGTVTLKPFGVMVVRR